LGFVACSRVKKKLMDLEVTYYATGKEGVVFYRVGQILETNVWQDMYTPDTV
jgi:hypothetical protein